jgi:CP family cyanate transporter-like MFS transporter
MKQRMLFFFRIKKRKEINAKRKAEATNGPIRNLKHTAAGGLMVTALFLASLNLRPAISSISPVLEIIRSDLGMNASVASLLTSIPVLCMGFFSPISVRIGRSLGIERVITWSLVLLSGSTLAYRHSFRFLFTSNRFAGRLRH